jgi:hypothetical protein
MSKRGQLPIGIILGIVVIVIIVFGLGTVVYKYAGEKLFGKKGIISAITPSEQKFQPYTGPGLTDDEKKAVDSMNALVCAISSMAAGRPGWLDPKICPEGFVILNPAAQPAATGIAQQPATQPAATTQQQSGQPATGAAQQPPQIAQAGGASSIDRSAFGEEPTGEVVAITGRAVQQTAPAASCMGDIAYGSTCVQCTQSSADLRPVTLDTNKQIALKQIVDETIRCWQKFLENDGKNVNCNIITVPKDLSGTISHKELDNALYASGSIGQELVGGGTSGYTNYAWDTEDPILPNAKSFYLCADDEAVDEVFITRDLSNCPLPADAWLEPKFECRIASFELPQKVTAANEWLPGNGDPKFLAYFEKFPAGEEKAWQTDAKTWFMLGLGVRGAFTMIPLGLGAIKMATKTAKVSSAIKNIRELEKGMEGLDAAAKEARQMKIAKELETLAAYDDGLMTLLKASSKANKGVFSIPAETVVDDVADQIIGRMQSIKNNIGAVEIGQDGVINKIVRMDNFKPSIVGVPADEVGGTFTMTGKIVAKNEIKAIAANAKIPITDDQVNVLISKAESGAMKSDDVAKFLRTEAKAESAAADSIEQTLAAGSKAELSSFGRLMKQIGFKKALKAYLKQGSLEKPMVKAVDGLKALRKTNPQLYDDLIKNADNTVKEFFDEAGNLKFNKLLDETPTDDMLAKLFKLDDAAAKTYGVKVNELRDLLSTKTIGKGVLAGSVKSVLGPFPEGTTWVKAMGILKNQLRGLGCIVPVAAGYVAQEATNDPTVTAVSATTLSLVTGAASPCIKFMRDHVYVILLGLSIYAEYEDSTNQKFIPVGSNMFGLVMPFGQYTYKNAFESYQSDKYYVEMIKEDKERNRFFAASPCKTDYDLFQTYRGCSVWHNDFIYEFTDTKGKPRLQIVEPNAGPTTVSFAWDSLSQAEKDSYLLDGSDNFWSIDPQYGPYFDNIRHFIRNDASKFIEFGELIWTDNETFTKSLFACDYITPLGGGGAGGSSAPPCFKLREAFENVTKLDQKQFESFRTELLDFIAQEKYSQQNAVFSFHAGTVAINIQRAIISRFANFVSNYWWVLEEYPVNIFNHGYWNDRKDCKLSTGLACPWKRNPNSPSDDWVVDWPTFNVAEKNQWESTQTHDLMKMLAVKVFNSKWMEDVARKSSLTIYRMTPDSPKNNVVKVCHESSRTVPSAKDLSTRFELKTKIPSIAVMPRLDESYNSGNNFCFSSKSPGLIVLGEVTDYVAITLGLATMVFTGNPGVMVAATAADIGSIIMAYVMEKCGKWPTHMGGFTTCF